MNKRKIFEYLFKAIFILSCVFILSLSLRGLPGNPTSEEINTNNWKEGGPFELSPERSRYALLYSVVEDKSLQFSYSLAKFVAPDLGVSKDGKYVSLFAPGVSFLLIPGYIIGEYFGIAQVGSFAMIALFALLNVILVRAIAICLGADNISASIGAFVFIFATPAFAYAVTIYQHHISTFIILLSIYALMRWKNYWSLALIWFLFGFSIVVDNPNLFFMIPIAVYAFSRIVVVADDNDKYMINIKLAGFLTFIAVILPIGFFLWFNNASHGNAFQLSGTLNSATVVKEEDESLQSKAEKKLASKDGEIYKKEKNAIGFFNTRNLINGFYIHFLSPDRGIINYAPIILFGAIGLFMLYRGNSYYANLLIAVIGFNILLYSMWGDPYGGWAFGSRYLIPAYALFGIGIGIFLTHWRKNIIVIAIFFAVFSYSAWVNSLGALTSNANPPRVEILELEKISGVEQKYTYERNSQYLKNVGSKSYVFQSYAKNMMEAESYHMLVYVLIVLSAAISLLCLILKDYKLYNLARIIKIK